ncbi:MAG TPA: hypothetical protein GX502_07995 [Syntrophaceticus sp.]|nr:hypothetical protein [Syntrophaceticus sp.]
MNRLSKRLVLVLCILIITILLPIAAYADTIFDWLNMDDLIEIFPEFPAEAFKDLPEVQQKQVFQSYVERMTEDERVQLAMKFAEMLSKLPTVEQRKNYKDPFDRSFDEYMQDLMEQLENTDLGPVFTPGTTIKQLNFLVSSTKKASEEFWALGKHLYFDIPSASGDVPDITVTLDMEHRITYEWWHELWEKVAPGVTVPHIYTIDGNLLKTRLQLQHYQDPRLPNLDEQAVREIIDYPYGRKFKPEINMRADIEIYGWDYAKEEPIHKGTFNQREEVTFDNIYNKTGLMFTSQTIQDMQSRFQTINVDVPPIVITIHAIEVEAVGSTASSDETMTYDPPLSVNRDGKRYEAKEEISTRKIVLPDVPNNLQSNPLVIHSGIDTGLGNNPSAWVVAAVEDPEILKGYKFISSAIPSFLDKNSSLNYFDMYYAAYPGPRTIYGYPRYNYSLINRLAPEDIRYLYPLGDFDVYFFYEKDAKPDFEAVSLDPGTEYSHPDKIHHGKATFRLKEEGYFWPHEADIFIKHNGQIIFEKRNVPFELGETKTFEFEWSGIELQDSKLQAEIWPSVPTLSVPKPGETLEDAYPPDNVIELTVLSGQVTLTIKKEPDLISVGTTDPEPGTYIVDRGTKVRLEAKPNNNWKFVRWKGAINTTEQVTEIVMDESKTVIAEFTRLQYKLTIIADPPQGGTTDPRPGVYTVDAGTLIKIEAFPGPNSRFVGWFGDASGTSLTTWVYIDGDKTVIAKFAPENPPPSPNPNGLGNPILVE